MPVTKVGSLTPALSVPHTRALGFKDASADKSTPPARIVPAFLPLIFGQSSSGDHEKPMWVPSDRFTEVFGSETLDPASDYYSVSNALVRMAISKKQNSIVYRRLTGASADYARIRLAIEAIPTKLDQYKRNLDGTYDLDSNGNRQIDATLGKIDGYRLHWRVIPVSKDDFGVPTVVDGTYVDPDQPGIKSKIYPITDFQYRWVGAIGRNTGIALEAANTSNDLGFEESLAETVGARIYKVWAYGRASAQSTPSVIQTTDGSQYAEIAFKRGAVNADTDIDYSANNVTNTAWENPDPAYRTTYSPFSEVLSFYANVDALCAVLVDAEKDFGTVPSYDTTKGRTLDLVSALSLTGVPYHTFDVANVLQGGASVSRSSVIYLEGGDSGLMSNQEFEAAVAAELALFLDEDSVYHDNRNYPFTTVVDGGFSLQVSKALRYATNRPDVWVLHGVQSPNQPLNSRENDISIGAAIRAAYNTLPESEYYDTAACRAVICCNGGQSLTMGIDGPVSVATHIFGRWCQYGGRSARLDPEFLIESESSRILTDLVRTNIGATGLNAAKRSWGLGLVTSAPHGPDQYAVTYLNTILAEPSSVLSDMVTMHIACVCSRIADYAASKVTGNPTFTPEVAMRVAKQYIEAEAARIFGDRVRVTANCFMTDYDAQLGWHWRTEVTLEANVGLKVNTFTVIAKRYSNPTTSN